MELILLSIVTFILAIDQFSLTELIYRPIIACPIIGLILGDLQTGLVVGGTYELMMIGNMPVGGSQPPNAVLGSVVAMIFTIKAGFKVEEALGASMVFALFGQYAVTTTFALMSGVMRLADKSAEEANPKGIVTVHIISMVILGGLFTLFAVLAYVGGVTLSETLQHFSDQAKWFMEGLGAAGGMMRFVGFAILLRIMLAEDMWGIYFAGFTAAAILGNIEKTAPATLLLVAFIGVAIALYDFNINVKLANCDKGGPTDGI